jgi:hypothetical protein
LRTFERLTLTRDVAAEPTLLAPDATVSPALFTGAVTELALQAGRSARRLTTTH